jgi:hypothetical protein
MEVSNVILGIAGAKDRFKIRYLGINWRLSIKPVSAKNLIRISGELSKIQDIDQTREMFPVLIENSKDLKYIARSISIATGTYFEQIVTRAILDLPLSDIQTLFNIVRKQTDMERFFLLLISIKGILRLMNPEKEGL